MRADDAANGAAHEAVHGAGDGLVSIEPDAKTPRWLQSRWLWWVVAALAALPLILPPVAPLTDLGGHLGRYAVQVDHGRSADLAQWYGFRWNLIPNLGVDILVEWLAPLLGLEQALRLIVAAIPVLQALGILALCKAVHRRITPLALFALPLAYCYPLHFGFLNFVLGQALATLALALWIFMGRRAIAHSGWLVARWIVFVPIACALWTCHLVAWALFCAFAGMGEVAPCVQGQRPDWRGLGRVAVRVSCLLTPQLLRMVWPLPASGHGATRDFFLPELKLLYPLMPLRDRWLAWDVAAAAVLLALVVWAMRRRAPDTDARDPRIGLRLGVLALGIVYLAMPGTIFGSSLADMRLVPFLLMIALVSARPLYRPHGWLSWARLAWLGAGFALARLLGNVLSLWLAGQAMAADLAALDSVPHGARVASLVVEECVVSILPWQRERRTHLGGYAIARRHAFSNEQWVIPGGQLLQVHAPQAGAFGTDESQLVKPDDCAKPNTISRRLAELPRAAFDYVWIIDSDAVRAVAGAVPVRRTPGSVLYRIVR